jgi:threonine dehydratase
MGRAAATPSTEPVVANDFAYPRELECGSRSAYRDAPAIRQSQGPHADAYLRIEDSLDLATCEGAATIGLELVRDDPGLDVVLLAVGGGAMASGVGYACAPSPSMWR